MHALHLWHIRRMRPEVELEHASRELRPPRHRRSVLKQNVKEKKEGRKWRRRPVEEMRCRPRSTACRSIIKWQADWCAHTQQLAAPTRALRQSVRRPGRRHRLAQSRKRPSQRLLISAWSLPRQWILGQRKQQHPSRLHERSISRYRWIVHAQLAHGHTLPDGVSRRTFRPHTGAACCRAASA